MVSVASNNDQEVVRVCSAFVGEMEDDNVKESVPELVAPSAVST